MDTPLTDYYENLRAALGDQGNVGAYTYKDEMLAAALRTTIQTGMGPRGVAISATGPDYLDPAPSTPDARGFLIFQTALAMIGGINPFSWKTRAMSVTMDPDERKNTVEHFRRQLQRLEQTGDPHGTGTAHCFGIWQDMENALCRTTDPIRIK